MQVAEDGLQEAKAKDASVKDELTSAEAETMRKFDVFEQQQNSLLRLTQMEDTSDSAGPERAADAERLHALETANAKLVTHVQKLKVEHALLAHASDIVIGGLAVSANCDNKLAMFADIKTIVPEFTLSEIQAVRCFTSKKVDTFASAAPTTVQVDSSTFEADALNKHASAAVDKTLGVSSKSTSKGFFGALTITLNNAVTAKNLRYAKVVWKRLTTS